jgi:uncharacterized protein (DUF697 family)
MPGLQSISAIWENISEVDLQALRQQAVHPVRIALVGASSSSRDLLAAQLRRSLQPRVLQGESATQQLEAGAAPETGQQRGLDPIRAESLAPLYLFDSSKAGPAAQADLVILLVDPDQADQDGNFPVEQALVEQWRNTGGRLLILVNAAGETPLAAPWLLKGRKQLLQGRLDDPLFLKDRFIPAVLELLPDHHLSLARHFPLFRPAVAQHLINDTCLSNASYSFSTGLVGLVPVLDIPLTVTDMVILTKNQAFLVYKLGLALGYSTRWQDYVAEFGSVLGSGFLWRQLARSLVGLIPGWGILPKTAVAYAGTYVVGQAVLQWDLTGRHISRDQMQRLYQQAAGRARGIARKMFRRRPRQASRQIVSGAPLQKTAKAGAPAALPKGKSKGWRIAWLTRRIGSARQKCPDCGKLNSSRAVFCQYCGHPVAPVLQNPEQEQNPKMGRQKDS